MTFDKTSGWYRARLDRVGAWNDWRLGDREGLVRPRPSLLVVFDAPTGIGMEELDLRRFEGEGSIRARAFASGQLPR